MTTVIVAEKPSAAKNFAAALGGPKGVYKGTRYEIVNLRGHLYEFVKPHEMLKDSSKSDEISKWNLNNLPWDPQGFTWKRKTQPGVSSLIRNLKTKLNPAAVTEIVNGADIDPTGEGDLLFWEVMDELNLHHKKFTRMEFVDESEKSIREAFEKRRKITSMMDEGGYRKADARSKMDLLTMQHTCIASLNVSSYMVLRQGRLKSTMVRLVGDQYEKWKNYVEVPFFQNRFEDNHGITYINPEEPRFVTESEVPNVYTDSPVKPLGSTRKKTPPPKLLDLAGLSARLSSQGVKAADVLRVYQKMYEAKIVSYPRTADKTITTEQFNELLPLSSKIAKAVGVDPSLLTHKQPRRSHVKDSGAHGANRPGPNVPASLSALQREYGPIAPKIYEILAKNYLAMLAPDYEYEQQKGCVEKYPKFVGTANVPKKLGWRAVFDADDDFSGSKGLGSKAKPYVHRGVNPRPPRPTMKWLMAQLEKHNVGTGATRTSIYADTVNPRHKFPLLVEKRGALEPTEFGHRSYLLLEGTNIGDITATEQFYSIMDDIEAGKATVDDGLNMVTRWVEEDKVTMSKNAQEKKEELTLDSSNEDPTKVSGLFNGEQIRFNRTFSGHTFTDQEVDALLAGEEIEFEAVSSRTGKTFPAKGVLAKQSFTANDGKEIEYYGFKLDTSGFGKSRAKNPDRAYGTWQSPSGPKEVSFKKDFRGYKFSEEEISKLLAGEAIPIYDLHSNNTGNKYSVEGKLSEQSFTNDKGEVINYVGVEQVRFINKPGVPDKFLGHTFTKEERETLESGGKIFVEGFVSKKGNKFDATVSYGIKDDGDEGLNLEFG